MATFRKFTSKNTFDGETVEKAVEYSRNNTDIVYPEIKLFVEGVQVPYESISISQVYNGRPSATIQIPPQSGLLDITRGYEPKVHIFYRDDNYGGFRLLFWGIIKNASYSKSRSGGGSSYIVFNCDHKNSVLDQYTLDFAGWTGPTVENQIDPFSSGGTIKPGAFNSNMMVIQAMAGINAVASADEEIKEDNSKIENAPTDKIPSSISFLEKRIQGMPGVLFNLWNQLKKYSFQFKDQNITTRKMYIPLFEEGISFFKRTSGHPILEEKLQNTKEAYCNKDGKVLVKMIVPPYARNSMVSAIQREMTVRNIRNIVGFSGELTSFSQVVYNFYLQSKYDVLTLASPAELEVDPDKFVDEVNKSGIEKVAVETIIKPELPIYYSPICNVILPRMFKSIQIQQNESSVPTRISANHDVIPGLANNLGISYKAPASYREAVAYNHIIANPDAKLKLDLNSTKAVSSLIPAKYEQGVGIRHEKIVLPWWLVLMVSNNTTNTNVNKEQNPNLNTPEYNRMLLQAADWKQRYAKDTTQEDDIYSSKPNMLKDGLNPYDPKNGISPQDRIMVSVIDYEHTIRAVSSKSGNIECEFNPYIIPGYPMDVVDDSPNHPSFHGFCTSVTHTITSRSISTMVSMVNAITYAELSNYHLLPASPFLQASLDLINGEIDSEKQNSTAAGDLSVVKSVKSTLLQNQKAKDTANTFYKQVLGVGAVSPDDLIHFSSGQAYPLDRTGGILLPRVLKDKNNAPNISPRPREGRVLDDYYSYVGNMRLVARPIESKDSISDKFSYKFIDLDPILYGDTSVNYLSPKLASDLLLEPGASLFLDYMEIDEFVNKVK